MIYIVILNCSITSVWFDDLSFRLFDILLTPVLGFWGSLEICILIFITLNFKTPNKIKISPTACQRFSLLSVQTSSNISLLQEPRDWNSSLILFYKDLTIKKTKKSNLFSQCTRKKVSNQKVLISFSSGAVCPFALAVRVIKGLVRCASSSWGVTRGHSCALTAW